MKCPKCGSQEDKVLETREARDGAGIRRRRECIACGCRFTTHEEIDREDLVVVKRDQTRQAFSRQKLERSVRVACQKRPISMDQFNRVIDTVVASLEGDEVPSSVIGERVMAELQKLDEVAYIRFASVYRRFTDVNQFLSTITELVRR